VSYVARLKAAASCSTAGAAAAAAGEESKGIAARFRDSVSCSSARGTGGDGGGQDTDDNAGTEEGAKDSSLLSRLKEASTCSPVTQVRVRAAMSHLPELPKMPEMPSQLSCAAPRSSTVDEDVKAVPEHAPSMLGRVKAAATCGYLPASASVSADGNQMQPMESGAGEGVLGRCVSPCNPLFHLPQRARALCIPATAPRAPQEAHQGRWGPRPLTTRGRRKS
jgi:hypothetical protein